MRSVLVAVLLAAAALPAGAHGDFRFGCRGEGLKHCANAERPWGFQYDGQVVGPVPGLAASIEPWLSISPTPVPRSGPHLSVTYEVMSTPPGAARTVRVEARWRTAKGRWSPWLAAKVPPGDVGFGVSNPATASWRAKVRPGTRVAWEWHLLAVPGPAQVLTISADVVHHE